MKRCAHCGQSLPSPREGVIICSDHVAGVPGGAWVGLQFCSPRCSFNCGASLGRAIASGHTIALAPEQFDFLESDKARAGYAPGLLN